MRRSFTLLLVLAYSPALQAAEFVSAVPAYTEGNFATVGGTHYTDPSTAIGKPAPIVGAESADAGILSPFNAHFETDQLVAFGRGGGITLQFPNAVAVTGLPQIGIFTKLSLLDSDYPKGVAGSDPRTDAIAEYGAERTAIVEVASNLNDFRSLGRVIFDDPTNYFANANTPFEYPAPNPAQEAAFDKPYSGLPADLASDSFAALLAHLNGSAGGTWISIPENVGLDSVQFVRLSDPLWRLPDGTLVEERASVYFPPPNAFIKPADLFIDAAILIPEPAMLGLLALPLSVLRRRR